VLDAIAGKLDIQGAFAFDTRERFDLESPVGWHPQIPR
jgi:hypothetical protein